MSYIQRKEVGSWDRKGGRDECTGASAPFSRSASFGFATLDPTAISISLLDGRQLDGGRGRQRDRTTVISFPTPIESQNLFPIPCQFCSPLSNDFVP